MSSRIFYRTEAREPGSLLCSIGQDMIFRILLSRTGFSTSDLRIARVS